ncbi:MAG: acetyl-CoA hydrolase/transferase [Sphingomonas bacterium]|uniref:acetyl-CoA hydrolase/transferase family protein n=1 Tax=Sphingomonas bacterium TaxID=1895847 RepID=UPI002625FA5A|nr:acetyl-CoA hydrolase/transferase C-terminal domain-containing protein [Sphingomonas bacterium]MDB5708767.1 acetyl-CoA hydrolase/transferase [Sphingomonas bacterium]
MDLSKHLRAGDHLFVGEGPGEPAALMRALVERRAAYSGLTLFMGLGAHETLLPEHLDHLRLRSYGALGTMRRFARNGQLHIVPCHLGQLPSYIASGTLRCDAVLVQLSPAGPDGRHSLGVVSLHLEAAIAAARTVIGQVNDQMPYTHGSRTIAPGELDAVMMASEPLAESPAPRVTPTERMIAGHVADFIGDGAVLQVGIGTVPDAVIACLGDRRDLGVHSGVIGDGVMALIERGVVTNARKHRDQGVSVTGMLYGSHRLYAFADANRAIAVSPAEYTHGQHILGELDRLISVNSAVEVDLTGQMNAEVAAGTYLGGIGGHGDFVRAGHRSAGGRAIVALPSTARGGGESRIQVRLRGPVTTARADADTIVTEYGAAELRGQPIAERMRRMIAIAHPEFRESLARESREFMPHGF